MQDSQFQVKETTGLKWMSTTTYTTHSSYVHVYYTFQLSVQFLIGYVVYINSTFASY